MSIQVLYHCFAIFTGEISSPRNSIFIISAKFYSLSPKGIYETGETYPRFFFCSRCQKWLAIARNSLQVEANVSLASCRMHIHRSPRRDPRMRSCSLVSSWLFYTIVKENVPLLFSPSYFLFWIKLYRIFYTPQLNTRNVHRLLHRSPLHRWKLSKRICITTENDFVWFYIIVVIV